MKTYLAIAGLCLGAGLLLVLFYPGADPADPPARSALTGETGPAATRQNREAMAAAPPSEDSRRANMEAAFSQLVELRGKLKSRVNFLKSRIWGLELPVSQAKTTSNRMKRAYVYLRNPPMLGAYSEVSDIEREGKKVLAMLEDLDEVEALIEAAKP